MHMSIQRTFSFSEASALLPTLKTMLKAANQELALQTDMLASAYAYYENCEKEMNDIKPTRSSQITVDSPPENNFAQLRQCRLNFQAAIESLSQAKQDYIKTLNFWFDEISDTGVILRDIKSGLLDFPANIAGFDYYLCWCLDDKEISHWHMVNDGFSGRKPLAALDDYL